MVLPSSDPGIGASAGAASSCVSIATWSNARLAEQTIVVPAQENNVQAVGSEVRAGVGGVVLFGSSVPAGFATALRTLVAQGPSDIRPFVMVDEEGGAVQRLENVVGPVPSARTMGATMTTAAIEQLGFRVGNAMKALGITMDLAPVLDVDGGAGPNNSDADGTRSFSATTSVAAADGIAFANGLLRAGVVPVVKHFPGLGAATGNSDLGPSRTLPWSQEQSVGLPPFELAVQSHLPAVMIANASVPSLTNLPASISPQVITGVLRDRLGFTGLVLTDSLSAGAVSASGYSVPNAAVAALRAGADMVLFNATVSGEAALVANVVQHIIAAVADHELSRPQLIEAVTHILSTKKMTACSKAAS